MSQVEEPPRNTDHMPKLGQLVHAVTVEIETADISQAVAALAQRHEEDGRRRDGVQIRQHVDVQPPDFEEQIALRKVDIAQRRVREEEGCHVARGWAGQVAEMEGA
jgi:hypothetical protein